MLRHTFCERRDMKKLTVLILAVVLTSSVYAAECGKLTIPERARTASFVFKAELFLACKAPFGIQQGELPVDHKAFIESWLNEDIKGMGTSNAGKAQTKRMEAVARSPIFAHFSETISGAATIRAYRACERFIAESKTRVDASQVFNFNWFVGLRYLLT